MIREKAFRPVHNWRPTILRRVFSKALEKTDIKLEVKEFFMGHDGPMISRYSMYGFNDEEIEMFRNHFRKVEKILEHEEDPMEKKKQELIDMIHCAESKEELERVQMLMESVHNCKTIASNNNASIQNRQNFWVELGQYIRKFRHISSLVASPRCTSEVPALLSQVQAVSMVSPGSSTSGSTYW